MGLVPSQELPTPSSASSSSQSDTSSTADRQDSANLDSMLDMISSQRHTEQPNSGKGTSLNKAQSGQLEPGQGCTTTAEATPVAVETTEGSSTALHEAGNDTADSEAPQPQQNGISSSADNPDGGSSTPPVHAPSKSASSPEAPAAHEAGSVSESVEDDDSSAATHASPAQPFSDDSQQSEQTSAKASAAVVVESDKPPQASCSDQARTEDGKHGDALNGTANGIGSASSESSTSGKEQPQQAEQRNGAADVDGKAPKAPLRKAPKKGGLVNVQRLAVKGYSIHRLASCLCHGCLSCAGLRQKTASLHFTIITCLATAGCLTVGLGPDPSLIGTSTQLHAQCPIKRHVQRNDSTLRNRYSALQTSHLQQQWQLG